VTDDRPKEGRLEYFGGPKDGELAPLAAEVRTPVISCPGDEHLYTPGLTEQGRRGMIYRGIRPA
jgi:hypothetical protein